MDTASQPFIYIYFCSTNRAFVKAVRGKYEKIDKLPHDLSHVHWDRAGLKLLIGITAFSYSRRYVNTR